MARISENELVLPSLFLMSLEKNGVIFTSDLKKKLVQLLNPTGEDAEISPSRPNEIKFLQIVGNLKSHDTFKRNGFATYQKIGNKNGFKITEAGKVFLQKEYATLKYIIANNFDWEDVKNTLLSYEKGKQENNELLFFDENIIIKEGLKKVTKVKVYERSIKLRNYAIKHFTKNGRIACECCTFDFENFYGVKIGKGFIEIHHTKPIFQYKDSDTQKTLENALQNLIPVCSNCHRMIHRNWSKPIEMQQLIRYINQNGIFKK